MGTVGRPRGSYTADSLRNRIRELLVEGRPMTPTEIAGRLREDIDRVRNALVNGSADRAFRSILVRDHEARYTLWGFHVEVRLTPVANDAGTSARQWWQV